MAVATSTALLLGAAATAGTAVISAQKTKKAAKAQAKAAEDAKIAQQTELDKQADIKAKQDKLVAERTERADAAATERKARLRQGKKGLLFEGDETGVAPTDVLGG